MSNEKDKPQVKLVERPDGRLLILGGTAAARYCGVSQQAFGRVIRDHARVRVRERTIYNIEKKIRLAYPELFADVDAQMAALGIVAKEG